MNFSPLKSFVDEACLARLPGADVRVRARGQALFEYRTGFSDAENEIETDGTEVWPAYSLTKLMTCACAMMAREEGRLGLDEPLGTYLPAFSRMRVAEALPGGKRIRDAVRPVTVRTLMSMTAGFGPDICLLPAGDTHFAVNALADQPLLCDPGEHWVYGLSHDVLGAVLETVYGMKLRDVFRQKLFGPLGLRHSCFLSEVEDLSALTPLYRAENGGYASIPFDMTYAPSPLYDSGGAGLVTSAGDFIRFLDALCTGRLISASSRALMCKDTLTPAARRDFCWPQLAGYGYGLGLRVPLEGSQLTDVGWGGAAGAYALMDIGRGVSMCFFTNVLGADEVYLYAGLRDALYSCL